MYTVNLHFIMFIISQVICRLERTIQIYVHCNIGVTVSIFWVTNNLKPQKKVHWMSLK